MQYRAELLAVEAKLSSDPNNEELLEYKSQLLELIELSGEFERDEEEERKQQSSDPLGKKQISQNEPSQPQLLDKDDTSQKSEPTTSNSNNPSEKDQKAKKDRKKKEKLREKVKIQADLAEKEKKSWQSFASKKGLKGITKKSIFASPCTVTGKVGVGTNGIADIPGRHD